MLSATGVAGGSGADLPPYRVQVLGSWGWCTVLQTPEFSAAQRDVANREKWAFVRLPTRIIGSHDAQ